MPNLMSIFYCCVFRNFARLQILVFTFFLSLSFATEDSAKNIEPSLSVDELALTSWLDSQEENMLTLLQRITNINFGTLNKKGVREVSNIFSQELRSLGFMMSRLPGNFIEMPSCPGSNYNIDVTDHLLAQKEGAGKRLLLMGHLDTVFPLNNSFQEFYCEGDMMYGPGVADMQGGLVVLLYTLKALAQAGELDDKTLTILLNSDEEIGALSSRKYVEE